MGTDSAVRVCHWGPIRRILHTDRGWGCWGQWRIHSWRSTQKAEPDQHSGGFAAGHSHCGRSFYGTDRCAAFWLLSDDHAGTSTTDRIAHWTGPWALRRPGPDHADVPYPGLSDGCDGHDHFDCAHHLPGHFSARIRSDLVWHHHRDDGGIGLDPSACGNECLCNQERREGSELHDHFQGGIAIRCHGYLAVDHSDRFSSDRPVPASSHGLTKLPPPRPDWKVDRCGTLLD